MVVLASDWSTQFISPSPEITIGIWTKPYGNHRLLKCVYISGKSIHKYGRLGLWLFDVFQTSALKLLHGFQQQFYRNQVITKCITSPTNWYFFWYSITTTQLSWYLIYLLVFNFSANTARIITKCKGSRYNSELILFQID